MAVVLLLFVSCEQYGRGARTRQVQGVLGSNRRKRTYKGTASFEGMGQIDCPINIVCGGNS